MRCVTHEPGVLKGLCCPSCLRGECCGRATVPHAAQLGSKVKALTWKALLTSSRSSCTAGSALSRPLPGSLVRSTLRLCCCTDAHRSTGGSMGTQTSEPRALRPRHNTPLCAVACCHVQLQHYYATCVLSLVALHAEHGPCDGAPQTARLPSHTVKACLSRMHAPCQPPAAAALVVAAGHRCEENTASARQLPLPASACRWFGVGGCNQSGCRLAVCICYRHAAGV